ncbi:MAG: helix-turn-helix domain-containing protein [Candidatus Marinimicrobia bacterium]|nr:helix-turn-helix domain-containing protein [Candidatus Neomarinimicrobiota bacterium]
MEQLYSLKSAAALLDVSVKTLRRLVHENNIQVYRVGSGIRIKESNLEQIIQEIKSIDKYYEEVINGID